MANHPHIPSAIKETITTISTIEQVVGDVKTRAMRVYEN